MDTKHKTQNTKHKKVFLCALTLFFVWFQVVSAATLTVSPVIIDLKAQARDILKESLTVTNPKPHKLNLYIYTNNILVKEGQQEFLDPSKADHASSLANWILIPRRLELLPYETKKIDFTIEVNLRAKPGKYHAEITFSADNVQGASTIVNLEVLEDIKEKLQLKRFISDKVFFSRFPVSLSYELENIGNKIVIPSGELRLFNRRGQEVVSIAVNEDQKSMEPGASQKLAGIWEGPAKTKSTLLNLQQNFGKFGRYKAFLDLEYGASGRGTINDTTFFWLIPWQKILIALGSFLAFFILFIYWQLSKRR